MGMVTHGCITNTQEFKARGLHEFEASLGDKSQTCLNQKVAMDKAQYVNPDYLSAVPRTKAACGSEHL